MKLRVAEAPDADKANEGRTLTFDQVADLLGLDLDAKAKMFERSLMAAQCQFKGYTFEIIHEEGERPQ